MRERNTSQPRGRAPSLVLVLCGVLLASPPVTAKYIFTEEPLARFSPAIGDQDLFGYAAALHLVDDTGASSDFQHAIQNTKWVAFSYTATNGSKISCMSLKSTYVCILVDSDPWLLFSIITFTT